VKNVFLILLTTLIISCNSEEVSFKEGRWEGLINTGITNLNLILDYDGNDAYLSIAEQGIIKLKVSDLTINNKIIKFSINVGQTLINFEGNRNLSSEDNKDKINGKFFQNGQIKDFSLSYIGDIPFEKPFDILKPSGDDKILYLNKDNIKLSARHRIPYKDSNKWAALIVAGSGPTDGDGNSKILNGDNNSLLRLSNALCDFGIPSIRIDKRGTGFSSDSIIKEEDQDFSVLIDDVKDWLYKLKEIYPNRKIVVMGHSQGSLVSMVASNAIGCDAFVSISATGFTIDETLKKQLNIYNKEFRDKSNFILDELKKGNLVNQVPKTLYTFFRPSVQPFLISYMKYDPIDVINKSKYPILIIQGAKDSQTSVEDANMLYNNCTNCDLTIIENMNHLLRNVDNLIEDKMTYNEDRLPISKELIENIIDFLTKIN